MFSVIFFLGVRKKVLLLQPQNGGTVAQLVEQRTENPRVTGSIPVGTTPKKAESLGFFYLSPFIFFILSAIKTGSSPCMQAKCPFGQRL